MLYRTIMHGTISKIEEFKEPLASEVITVDGKPELRVFEWQSLGWFVTVGHLTFHVGAMKPIFKLGPCILALEQNDDNPPIGRTTPSLQLDPTGTLGGGNTE